MNSVDVVAGANAQATDYNNLRKDLVLGNKQQGTDTDGTTVTFDLSDKTKGNIRSVTLGGARTLAVSNPTVGQVFLLRLIQDGSGGRLVTWFSTIHWVGGSAPVLTTTPGNWDVFAFLCTAANVFDGYVVGENLS